jgi:hypothetical protein
MRQVEKFEFLLDEYDNRLVEMKTVSMELQQQFFRAVEELEDKFSVGVKGVATDLIERMSREELAEDYLDDEAVGLVTDKDVCVGVLSSSHDLHVARILKREDEARSGETKRYQETIANYANSERKRNRDRILEIHEFSKSNGERLDQLAASDEDDGADDDDAHK